MHGIQMSGRKKGKKWKKKKKEEAQEGRENEYTYKGTNKNWDKLEILNIP